MLRNYKHNYKIFFENANDAIYFIDLHGNFIDVNNKFLSLSGYKRDEIIGKNFAKIDLITSDSLKKTISEFNNRKNGIIGGNYEIIVKNRKGELFTVELNTELIKENGKPIGILGVARDISERKILEKELVKSEDVYRTLFENSGMASMIVQNDTTISLVNRKFEELSGYSKKEIEGKKSFLDLVDIGYKSIMLKYHKIRRNKKKNVPSAYEILFVKKNGEKRIAEINVGLIPNTSMSIASLRDITEKRNAETELKKRNEELMSLYILSTSLQEKLDPNKIMDLAIGSFKILGFDRVRVYLYDEKTNSLIGKKATHLDPKKFRKVIIPLDGQDKKSYICVYEGKTIIKRTEKDSFYKSLLQKNDVRESASFPLLSKDKIIGMISVDNKFSKKPIKENEIQSLMTFSNQIAVALENALLYQKNLDRIKRISTLFDVAQTMSSTLDLDKVLNLIVIRIVKIFRADACSILLLNDDKTALIPKAMYNLGKNDVGNQKSILVKDNDVIEQCFDARKLVYIKNMQDRQEYNLKQFFRRKNMKTCVYVPLSIKEDTIGVIVILLKKIREFSEGELDLLTTLGNQAALIIKNSEFYETIKADRELLSTLHQIIQEINSTLLLEKQLEILLSRAVEFTGAGYGALLMEENKQLVNRKLLGISENDLDVKSWSINEGITGWAYRNKKPFVVADVNKDSRYVLAKKDTISEAAIPLIVKDRVLGVLNLESSKYNNFERFRNCLQILTNHASIAIENSMLYDEIKNFNNKLQDEIYKATRELREKNIELERLNKIKSDFVSSVSHELRTPLTSISGYAKLLLNGNMGILKGEQKESIGIIVEETDRLTRMINELLDLSKLESGKIKFKVDKFDICLLAKETLDIMSVYASEKQIKIINLIKQNKKGILIQASRDLLKQVFLNLLNNSVKFTPKNGTVELDVKTTKEFVKIIVSDTGVGIPKEAIPKLFDKFYQVDSSITKTYSGTGLGLSIVKQIVDLHNGKIDLKSKVGKGTKITISIPKKL